MKILLAKTQSMYYLRVTKTLKVQAYKLAAYLFISLSFFLLQSKSFADVLDKSAEEYRSKGYEEQLKGNYDRALTHYAKAVSLGSRNASIYNDIGIVYEQLGLLDRAEESYLMALRFDPNYLPPYTNLAYVYKTRGEKNRAIAYLRERYYRCTADDPWKERIELELIQLDPEFEEQFVQQQLAVKKLALKRKAQEEFSLQVVRSERHFQKALDYYESGNFKAAIDEIDLALSVTPENPKLLKIKKEVLYKQRMIRIKEKVQDALELLDTGDLRSAKDEFQDILAIIPDESVR